MSWKELDYLAVNLNDGATCLTLERLSRVALLESVSVKTPRLKKVYIVWLRFLTPVRLPRFIKLERPEQTRG